MTNFGTLSLRASLWQKKRASFISRLQEASDFINLEVKHEPSIHHERAVPIKELSKESYEKLIDLFYNGATNSQIASELQIMTEDQVKYYLAKQGLRREYSTVEKASL